MIYLSNIPTELKGLKQWCGFKLVDRGGKKTKIPINAYNGELGKSNDESTWADFQTAHDAIEKFGCDGVGFYFKPPYFGIDIDNVSDEINRYKNGDHDNNIVSEFIEVMSSYAEYSVSKTGIHIIAKGSLPAGGRRKNNIEMYDSGRFFIMTGNIASEYKTIQTDYKNNIQYLHNKYISSSEIKKNDSLTHETGTILTENEIINIARNSKTGMRFSLFMDGGWEQFYNSQSEADMSFCNDLAFWTNRDAGMMDSIFRDSSLYRDKWDQKRGGATYGEITINRAISDCTNVFIPANKQKDFNIYVLDNDTQAIQKKYYSYDDTGNAQRLYDAYNDSIRFNYTRRNWFYYDGKVWRIDNEGMMKKLVDSVIENMKNEPLFLEDGDDVAEVKKAFTRHIKNTRNNKGKVNMLKECEHLSVIQLNEFDQNMFLFNTQNGYLNLKTGELLEHDRKQFFTKISNVEYTEKIDCPLWINFLNQIFDNNQELIRYVQKIVGYSLSGSTEEQMMFILYGNGRNGKSVFLDIITEMLGSYATNIQPQALMIKQNASGANSDIARLNGARLVTTTESNEGARLDEGLVKQLTGSDKVTARFLYENEFDFIPQFKLWMATNHKPIIRGTDEGIWRRFAIIPFAVQIPESQVDKTLKYKLRRELTGILKWAVDGFLLWQREGLREPLIIKQQREEYRVEMDTLEAFISDCCIRKDNSKMKAQELYKIYKSWAIENEQYLMSSTKFGREMNKKFQKIRSNGSYYIGIQLIEEYEKPFFRLNY